MYMPKGAIIVGFPLTGCMNSMLVSVLVVHSPVAHRSVSKRRGGTFGVYVMAFTLNCMLKSYYGNFEVMPLKLKSKAVDCGCSEC